MQWLDKEHFISETDSVPISVIERVSEPKPVVDFVPMSVIVCVSDCVSESVVDFVSMSVIVCVSDWFSEPVVDFVPMSVTPV